MKTPDIEAYRKNKPEFITNIMRRDPKNWEELSRELSLYCACIGFPVIVAIVFAQEEFPQFNEELAKSRKSVEEFYDYVG